MKLKLRQKTADRLAAWAYINEVTEGELIDAMVYFCHKGSMAEDEAFQGRFNELFRKALARYSEKKWDKDLILEELWKKQQQLSAL